MSKQRKNSVDFFNGLEEICFPVRNIINPMWANKDCAHKIIGLLPFDDGKTRLKELNTCSSRYKLIPNKDIFPKLEQMLMGNNIEYKKVYSHVDHVMFFVKYIITDERFAFVISGTNDKIYLKIKVQHSYNGKKVFKIVVGWFRLICSNGLTVPVAEMQHFNFMIMVKHTDKIVESLELFNEMLVNIINNAPAVIAANKAAFTKLAKVEVEKTAFEETLEKILTDCKINIVDNKSHSTIKDIAERAIREAEHPTLGYNGKLNMWLTYNAINQYIHDDAINVKFPDEREEIDSRVLEHIIEMVL